MSPETLVGRDTDGTTIDTTFQAKPWPGHVFSTLCNQCVHCATIDFLGLLRRCCWLGCRCWHLTHSHLRFCWQFCLHGNRFTLFCSRLLFACGNRWWIFCFRKKFFWCKLEKWFEKWFEKIIEKMIEKWLENYLRKWLTNYFEKRSKWKKKRFKQNNF